MRRLLVLIVLLAIAGPVFADAKADLFRAQDLERGEGDWAKALEFYRRAEASVTPAIRAEARLGAARCLRRLDRIPEARRTLKALLAESAPERFHEAAKAMLERLPDEEKLPPPPPEPPDPGEEARKEAKLRHELAGWFVRQAKAFLGEARYDDARERLARALALDPAHEEARALFERLGDTPGGRERLVREVLRLLDYERELRLAELSAEIDARIAAGDAALRIGDLDGAVLRFERAEKRLAAHPEFAGDLTGRRTRLAELRRRAVRRGGRLRTDGIPEEAPVPVPTWRKALRELLLEMASSPPGNARLRIHDVHLPPGPPAEPSGPRPFAHEGRPADAPALLARVLARHATSDPYSFVRPFGDALVAGGPGEFQEAIAGEVARINTRQGRPIHLRVLAVALSPVDLSLVHGVVDFRPASGTTRSGTIVNPEQAGRFVDRLLSPEIGDVVAQADLTLLPGASVALSRMLTLNLTEPGGDAAPGTVRYGLRLSLLAHRERDGPLRVAVDGASVRVGKLLGLPIAGRTLSVPEMARTPFSVVASVPEGGAWFEAGLANPFARDGDTPRDTLLLIFRTLPATDGETDAPEPTPAAGPRPVDLRGLDARPADDPSPAFRGEGARAAESREAFLLRHLWRRVGDGGDETTLALSAGAAWVEGEGELLQRTREAVAELAAAREKLIAIRVRAAVVKSSEEESLSAGRPSVGTVLSGEGVKVSGLDGEALRRTGYVLSGVAGRYPLLRERLWARPTQLVHTIRSTRSNYLSGFFGEPTGSFPVYESVEEGLAVEVRPVPRKGGGIDLELTVRIARVLDDGPESRNTPQVGRPVLTVTEARISAPAGKETALLVTGLPAPTPVTDRRDRLVLLVEAAEAEIPK